jgi:2-polyprenyl-6-methoxyphenol hydroxylase-like FAD-dependent oxidoreductase
MTEPIETDVLICGAGAAGLTLAIELARRHIAFRIIEKQETPFGGSRGKGIQPRSLEIFEDIGIVDRLASVGGAYPPLRKYAGNGTFVDIDAIEATAPTPAVPYPSPLMVPQFVTERILRDRLAEQGHRVEYGNTLRQFDQDAEGVCATVTNERGDTRVRARYLVGTDGGRSLVRQTLDIGFPGKTLGLRAFVADVHMRGLSGDVWHRFNDASMNHLAICALAGTDLSQLQGPLPMEGDIDLSVEGLNAMVATRTGRDDIVIDDVNWSSAYSMSARLADRYREGRVFIAGDAAHIHPPTGGQGLNTSVQDAYNLGWKLASVLRGGPLTLLDTYEEERRPVAAQMLDLATLFLDREKRGDSARGVEARQLHIGYPESSLTLQTRCVRNGVQPGHRAPDALMLGRAGQPMRLFTLFKGTHWTLLRYQATHIETLLPRPGLRIFSIGDNSDLIDAHSDFEHAYRLAANDHVLIRPDGYIAAIMSADELPAMERYLASWGMNREA